MCIYVYCIVPGPVYTEQVCDLLDLNWHGLEVQVCMLQIILLPWEQGLFDEFVLVHNPVLPCHSSYAIICTITEPAAA